MTLCAAALSLALRVVGTVILARVLTPSDFGVVAMVTTFSLFLISFGLNGFTEAVIQFPEIDHYTASNLFWLNICAGLVLGLAFAATGPLLASFFHNPVVTGVTIAMSMAIVIAPISTIHSALLKRAMRFNIISANESVALAVYTAVSLALASNGWGYWALVAGIVAQQLSITIGICWFCRWVPSLPRQTSKTGPMVGFAAKVFGEFSLSYLTLNIDNMLVGWRFNASVLGFYKRAFDLFALTASQLTAPLNNVALATLSRLNHDHASLRRHLSNVLGMIAFAGMAMGVDLTLVGNNVVRLVLGPKWSEAAKIFDLFGPGIGAMLLCSTVGWIHLSVGKPGRWLRWSLFQLATTACYFLVALPWGPEGVAAAWSVSFWTLLVPGFWYAGRPIGFGVSAFVAAIWRYVVGALVAGLATVAIFRGTPFWGAASGMVAALESIVIVSTVVITLYLGAIILLHSGLAPLRELSSLLRELTPSRKVMGSTIEVVAGCE